MKPIYVSYDLIIDTVPTLSGPKVSITVGETEYILIDDQINNLVKGLRVAQAIVEERGEIK